MPSPAKVAKALKKTASSKAAVASTSATTLIDSHVSSSQALKALSALQTHRQKHTASQKDKSKSNGKSVLPLDGEGDDEGRNRTDDMVYLTLTVKKLAKAKSSKLISVPLPHALNPPTSTAVCLFVKDPQRTYKDLLPTLGVSTVHRIVGVSKLKGKFAPFEARRNLMDEYDLFLCDDRIAPLMPRLLGNKWLQRKSKVPVNVNVVRTRHIKEELDKAIGGTRFGINRGSNISVPIGSLAHYSASEILENLSAALPKVVGKIPFGAWDNVQNVEVKTGKSASLPVWNVDLQDRWTGIEEAEDEPMISDDEEEEENEESSEEEEKAAPPPKKAKATSAAAAAQAKKTKSSTQTDLVKPAAKKQAAVDGKVKKAKK